MPPSLRVATYNVHACVGTDGRHDPNRVASVVAELEADIIALQEFTYAAGVAIERSPRRVSRTPLAIAETPSSGRDTMAAASALARAPAVSPAA